MTPEVPEYEIRLMKREELQQVLDLRRETNYTEGTHTIDTYYEYDPEGFYVAVTTDGTVIGSCAGILQHNDLAVIGLYIVKSTLQRRGIGRKIWNKVMERVGARNVVVHALPDHLEKYRNREGFPIQSNWLFGKYVATKITVSEILNELPGIHVRVLEPEDSEGVNKIKQYDADVLGFSRARLITLLCREKDTVTVIATNSHDDSICGYGTIKQDIKGNALVAPLFADNSFAAELIIYHMVMAFPTAKTKGVALFTVDCNGGSVALVEKLGFKKKINVIQLHRSKKVEAQFQKIFATQPLSFSVF